MSAEANSVVQPRTKPNPGPKTLPAITRMKKTISMPAVPAPNGRNAAPIAERTPNMAIALASMPPPAISANTMARTSTKSAPNISGAMEVSPNLPGATTNGQRKATNPMNEAMATIERDRRPTRMATAALVTG
jgi:hypothetical protein